MDLNALMQQAKQMQEDLKKTQTELGNKIYEGSSNGLVIKMNGKNEVQEVNIPQELMEDKDMLQDVLLIAFNNAADAVNEDRQNKIGETAKGLNIPGM
ncbi:MAG: YbaB/EbfC family nucleoid-associated protein [Erysipelotrichaceae bacterium]|jgi:DNA-binding YbaB/EbfC family protein|nr:YbaB/EbfC family nucleoid-associated protein [Erysipelotrichaceae bacterium]